MIAASHKENLLRNVVSSWKPRLTDLVSSSIPKKAGRKSGPQRYRPSRVAQQRNVQDLEQTTPTKYQFPEEEKFTIRWLEGSKVTTCYGCKNRFRKTASDPVSSEPYNIVLCRKQIRAYTPKGTTGLRFTVKPENTYFHLKKSCIQNDTSERIGPQSIRITEDIKGQLKPIHLNKSKQEVGVNI